MVHRALEMEGTCTVSGSQRGGVNSKSGSSHNSQGEHGIGLGKKDFLRHELGDAPIQVMRAIKRSLDPHWLMNPGKIFDSADV